MPPRRRTAKERLIQRIILTGTPGAGKTTIIEHLATAGHTVVAEAATDLIAAAQTAGTPRPWDDPGFVDAITTEQARRQHDADTRPGPVHYYDRSPVCTLALARPKHSPVSPVLAAGLDRISAAAVYDRRVLFIEHLGFITRTPVRRIGLDEALHFEQLHRDAYRERGYDLVPIPPAPPAERAAQIINLTNGAVK